MATPAFVQQSDSGSSTITSGSAATILSANSTAGHTVVAMIQVRTAGTGTVSTVSSSIGTFTFVGSARISGSPTWNMEIWSCVATGAATTITVTTSDASAYKAQVSEWSGAGVGGVALSTSLNATSTSASLTVTPKSATDAVYVWLLTAPDISSSPTGSWTNYSAGGWTVANGLGASYQVVTSITAVTATWPLTTSVLNLTIAATISGAPVSGKELVRTAMARASFR